MGKKKKKKRASSLSAYAYGLRLLLPPQQGQEGSPNAPYPGPRTNTYFQNIRQQLWILLDLRAEDSGELNFFLFREGSRDCPTKSEKFLKEERRRNPEEWGAGKQRP